MFGPMRPLRGNAPLEASWRLPMTMLPVAAKSVLSVAEPDTVPRLPPSTVTVILVASVPAVESYSHVRKCQPVLSTLPVVLLSLLVPEESNAVMNAAAEVDDRAILPPLAPPVL